MNAKRKKKKRIRDRKASKKYHKEHREERLAKMRQYHWIRKGLSDSEQIVWDCIDWVATGLEVQGKYSTNELICLSKRKLNKLVAKGRHNE